MDLVSGSATSLRTVGVHLLAGPLAATPWHGLRPAIRMIGLCSSLLVVFVLLFQLCSWKTRGQVPAEVHLFLLVQSVSLRWQGLLWLLLHLHSSK